MHANYCFLLNLPTDASDDELVTKASVAFDTWLSDKGDENNWATPSVLVTKTGRIIQMCEKDDWRGRDQLYEHIKEQATKAKKDPFEFVHRLALDCVVHEIGCFDLPRFSFISTEETDKETERLDSLSFEQLVSEVHKKTAKLLSDGYLALIEDKPRDPEPPVYKLEDYKRRHMGQAYEMFRDSFVIPFSETGTPYDYRAFDISRGEITKQMGGLADTAAILIVDIHT